MSEITWKYIRVSTELVEMLSTGWSMPVQVRIDDRECEDGELQLIFREYPASQ